MKYYLTAKSDSVCSHFSRIFRGLLQDAQKLYNTIVLILCVAVLSLSLLLKYNDGELYIFGFKWPMRCFLYQNFGIKCSLCGLTHSFYWLTHGSLRQSLMSHPFGLAVFIFICLQVLYRIHTLVIYPRMVNKVLRNSGWFLLIVIAVGIFINWLIYLGGFVL
jgi:hypothetical protein